MEVAHQLDLQSHSIGTADIVHLATGNPEYHMRAAEEASRQGKRVAFDPGQELHYKWEAGTFTKMLGLADMLFLNNAELQRALKYTRGAIPHELLDHVDTIVLTNGRRGSSIMDENGTIKVPMVPAERVEDTTGAGDAFRGGFYAGVHREMTPRNCLLLGAATASFIVERQGPQTNIPSFEQAWGRALGAGATED
jgi:ribokinase